jgi:hypothetical protein
MSASQNIRDRKANLISQVNFRPDSYVIVGECINEDVIAGGCQNFIIIENIFNPTRDPDKKD